MDIDDTPFEWRWFFVQFELYRIQAVTGCRYLLPVCLGHSVRGLMLLADGEAEGRVAGDPAAHEFVTLGLAALRR